MFNSNPSGYKKRTSPGGIKFISTSIFEKRRWRELAHTFRFISGNNMVCVLISDVWFNGY
jgi:hypothetical protein